MTSGCILGSEVENSEDEKVIVHTWAPAENGLPDRSWKLKLGCTLRLKMHYVNIYIYKSSLTQLTYGGMRRRLHVSTLYSHHQALRVSTCTNYSNYCALGIPVLQKYVSNIKLKWLISNLVLNKYVKIVQDKSL
jgi:hypothetical protein